MRGPSPLSAVIFALLGALLLVSALALGILGSFAYLAVASVGMFFIAAALVVFGMTALGWGILTGAALLALLNARRAGTQR